MAAQLRPLNGREVIRKLRKAGFEIVRVKGSAHYLRNPRTGRLTSVHVHGNHDIPLGDTTSHCHRTSRAISRRV